MESLTKCDFFGNAFCKNVHRLRANRKHTVEIQVIQIISSMYTPEIMA